MTYLNSLAAALSRSLDVAVSATRAAVRMDVAPTARSHGALPLYALKRPEDLPHFATGADADIGGLSSCRLVLDAADGGRGRFFGTLSTQIPRGGRIERSGYAGFRNKVSCTLVQTGRCVFRSRVHGGSGSSLPSPVARASAIDGLCPRLLSVLRLRPCRNRPS